MPQREPRITGPTLKVFRALWERPMQPISGAEITRATGLASGTLYPILFRLEQAEWLESEWEQVDPSEVKRPRRRLYRMTGLGQENIRASFREVFPKTLELAT